MLDAIVEHTDAAGADPTLLARPVVVVVPSRSLRRHLCARLVERLGRPLAGVEVVTLRALAERILVAAGESVERGTLLLPVLVGRFARHAEALDDRLGSLRDGFGALVGTVRDLLDAGFQASHADALDERLRELGGELAGVAEIERARAIVRVARAVDDALATLGIGRGSTLLRRAMVLLAADPNRVLPARAVLIHGFAEATGVASDLLEALIRHRQANAFVDLPPDPAEPGRADLGCEHARRLEERLRGVAHAVVEQEAETTATTMLELVRATGIDAEAAAVATRLRALLDRGVIPELVGVVARDLAPYQAPLTRRLEELGVPFALIGAPGSVTVAAARVRALCAVLEGGGRTTLDDWLTAACPADHPDTDDLKLAMRAAGVTHLAGLAALDAGAWLDNSDRVPLPVRLGLEDDEGKLIAPRRRLAGAVFRHAVARARTALDELERWPPSAPVEHTFELLRELLAGPLDWLPEPAAGDGPAELLAVLAEQLPASVVLEHHELIGVLTRALGQYGREALGADGGGVRVMSVLEARACTFSHLTLLGLNRDVFPRRVTEDPLLPDRLRAALTPVLPDLPIKRTGHDEERYLFAQLLSASPEVTLSWLDSDEQGRVQSPSPLLARIMLAHALEAPAPVLDPVFEPRPPAGARPAFEHALRAGVRAGLPGAQPLLALALAEAWNCPAERTERVAAARLATLAELDPDRRTAAGRARCDQLGPYCGLVGGGERPRLAVTTLEAMARCPWRAFLTRVLRLAPGPDPAAALPEVASSLVGEVVHATLHRLVRDATPDGPRSLTEALASSPRTVRFPASPALAALLREEAEQCARASGLGPAGFGRALAEAARPFVERAGQLEWSHASRDVLGAELRGTILVTDAGGRTREVELIVDRVDAVDDAICLSDYKTGALLADNAKLETRDRALARAVASGQALQAAAYVRVKSPALLIGRYVYLRPEVEYEEARELAVRSNDGAIATAFERAAATLLSAWDAGAFVPRVATSSGRDDNPICSSCEVAEACLIRDSGTRRRIVNWMLRSPDGGAEMVPLAQAAARLWWLGHTGTDAGEEESA